MSKDFLLILEDSVFKILMNDIIYVYYVSPGKELIREMAA